MVIPDINNRLLDPCLLHYVIDSAFARSTFGKNVRADAEGWSGFSWGSRHLQTMDPLPSGKVCSPRHHFPAKR